MLKYIKKPFNTKKKTANKTERASIIQNKIKTLDALFLWHLDDLAYFKKDSYETVMKHLKNELDINMLGNKLTLEQKKELGLNPRLSISSSLIEILSQKGLSLPNPKKALEVVYYRAKFEHTRLSDLNQFISCGFTEITYLPASDIRDCEWCKKNHKMKFPITVQLNEIIKHNCTCEWNRSCLIPVL